MNLQTLFPTSLTGQAKTKTLWPLPSQYCQTWSGARRRTNLWFYNVKSSQTFQKFNNLQKTIWTIWKIITSRSTFQKLGRPPKLREVFVFICPVLILNSALRNLWQSDGSRHSAFIWRFETPMFFQIPVGNRLAIFRSECFSSISGGDVLFQQTFYIIRYLFVGIRPKPPFFQVAERWMFARCLAFNFSFPDDWLFWVAGRWHPVELSIIAVLRFRLCSAKQPWEKQPTPRYNQLMRLIYETHIIRDLRIQFVCSSPERSTRLWWSFPNPAASWCLSS